MNHKKAQSTVLVTGATGLTGGHLARTLAARGQRVRALARPGADTRALQAQGIEIARGHLTRREDVLEAARHVNVVYHIAAAYRTARQPDSYYFEVNAGGTESVVAACEHWNIPRLVHCSTAGVHGHISRAPGTEESPLSPGDVYQESKLEGERIVQSAIGRGLSAVIVRPGAIYGPGDMRLLKLFRSVQRRRFLMFGRGEVKYHLVYIDDLVEGFQLAAQSPAAGQTFILAGPRSTTLNELVMLVARAVGAPSPRLHVPLLPLMAAAAACEAVCRTVRLEPPLHRRRADFFVKNRSFSIDKARRVLGFEPQVEPEQGLRRTAQWYAQQGLIAPVPTAEDLPQVERRVAQEVAL
jgi:dihydroflavonol-4-reductase